MPDIFDNIQDNTNKPDVFDSVKMDIFDKVDSQKTQNIADKITNYVLPQWLTEEKFEKDNYNLWGDVGERIPGAMRAGFEGKNPIQGFIQPSTIPSTGEYLYLKQNTQPTGNKVNDVLEAAPAAFVGEALDMAMNPFTYIGGAMGKSKYLQGESAKAVAKTKEMASAVEKFAKPVTDITKQGFKNIRLTFGTPMRNFRKFVAKQNYDEQSLRNLPLQEQITAQSQSSKAKTILKNQELTKQTESLTENIQRTKESKMSFQQLGQAVKQDISTKKQLVGKQKQSDFALQRINDREARRTITDNIRMLDDELTKVSQQGAEDVQPLLKDFFKNNSKAYGERLDQYSEVLGNSNKPLTLETAFGILDDTTKELDNMQINSGRGRALLDNLKSQYNPYNEEGKLTKDLSSVIDFKKFNQEVKDILKSLSSSFKSGIRVSQEDLAQVVLHDKYGNYIAENVPAFQELQQAYRPVINGMKEAGKVFKPYASEFQKTSGADFLKKVATGKQVTMHGSKNIALQETNLLNFIEQGTEFSKGIGNVSGKAKEVGSKLLAEQNLLEKTKLAQRTKLDTMMKQFTDKVNSLDEGEQEVNRMLAERSFELSNQIDNLQKGKMSIEKVMEANKLNGEMRQLQLVERKMRVDKLIHIKRKALIIKAAITGTAAVPTGIPQAVGRWALRSTLGDTASNR